MKCFRVKYAKVSSIILGPCLPDDISVLLSYAKMLVKLSPRLIFTNLTQGVNFKKLECFC